MPTDPAASEARLAELAPGYLERVRTTAGRLAVPDHEPSDVRAALQSLEDATIVDVDIPTASRQPMLRVLKRTIKGLIGWYLRYLGQQITALGEAVVHVGATLADRTDEIEARAAAVEQQLTELTVRVEHLERGGR